MKYTSNFGFKKPELLIDNAMPDPFNDNADILDEVLKDLQDNTNQALETANGKAGPSVVKNVTLTVAGWSGTSAPFTQTVSVPEVTASNNIYVTVGSGASAAEYAAAVDAQLHCSAQGAGTITMKAFDTKPTVAIPLTVLILG
jgi:hypothetical protein